MQEPSALGRIVDLVRDLRKRCPWDAAQTPESLRTYLVEEVLELDHAIATGDQDDLRTELGDVLLHVAFQIVLAEEQGLFGAEDLTRAVEEKMWRRHPHLYGDKATDTDQAAPSKAQVAERWERIKRRESEAPSSIVDGLPPNLPALLTAFRLQERAAGVGFDWPNAAGPRNKIREELDEVADLGDGADESMLRDEIGDLLFAVVNLARKLGVDPRAALEQANTKFSDRFRRVEQLAAERGIEVGHADLKTLDGLWNEAKKDG